MFSGSVSTLPTSLTIFEIYCVVMAKWEELTPARYKSKYLSRLRGLKSITVLFRDDDDDDEDNDSFQDVNEENDGGEIANDEDNRELNNRHDCSKELDTEVTKLQARADELKREYAKLSKNQDGVVKDFRCMDRCAAQLFGSKNDDPGSDDPHYKNLIQSGPMWKPVCEMNYEPLAEDEIRILHLHPALSREAEIRCGLSRNTLEPLTYSALLHLGFSFFPQDTASAKGPRNQVLGILIFDIRLEGKCFLETTILVCRTSRRVTALD
ncbi:hypothetical protein BKA61DRAFT_653067 [Leptodontidium sp. MPI-SDFR-AT-0119]|nr:hypothetical protein BKA61DRAFT_653067 [Leptodontidium sp. MPI-SDFR-AT-0119]